MSSPFHIRSTTPEDASLACPLIYLSGKEDFDYFFSTAEHSALDFLIFAFSQEIEFLSHKVHQVIACDEKIIGVGAFYSGNKGELEQKNIQHIANVLEFYGEEECAKILIKEDDLDEYTPAPDEETLYMANLAVSEAYQKKGAMTALVLHQIERARAAGLRFCALDVNVDNLAAEKLYLKLGFETVWERPFLVQGKPGSLPDVRRMVLKLGF